jgi:hypothetical protein
MVFGWSWPPPGPIPAALAYPDGAARLCSLSLPLAVFLVAALTLAAILGLCAAVAGVGDGGMACRPQTQGLS